LHTISCPPLVELIVASCLGAGARAALPGEFTLRGFLAGKLDLTRAEAVLAVIEAGSRAELKLALAHLAGGVTRPLQELRDYLVQRLDLDGVAVELVDTAGWHESSDGIEAQAQHLGREQQGRADLVLLCLEAGTAPARYEQEMLERSSGQAVVGVATKCDL